jgi:hypothetical protein
MAGGGGSPHLYQNADFFNSRFWLCHKKIVHAQNQTRVYVQFLLARQSHQAPRSITVPVLLLVGIFRVHYLYLNPKTYKNQIFSTDILYRAPVEKGMHTNGFRYKECTHLTVGTGNVYLNPG